jgi:hypothetical protein
MELLRRFSAEGRNVSDKPNASNYAPTAFVAEDEAKKYRLKKPELEQAMRSLNGYRIDRLPDAYAYPLGGAPGVLYWRFNCG